MEKLKRERAAMIIVAAISIILWILLPFQTKDFILSKAESDFVVTPRTFPIFCFAIIILFSLVEVYGINQSIKKLRAASSIENEVSLTRCFSNLLKKENCGPLVVMAVSILSAIALTYVGFIVVGIFVIGFLGWYLGSKNMVLTMVVAVLLPVVFYLVFKNFLHIPLPQGLITFL